MSQDPIGLLGGMNGYMYTGLIPVKYTDPLGLYFVGKCLAKEYQRKYGKDAWAHIRFDRDSTQPVAPGSKAEEMRNAEHYLYAYQEVSNNSYEWGIMHSLTTGYHAVKFWANTLEYYKILDSPYTYTIPTSDELQSGYEGANDALFGCSEECN